MSDPVFLWTMLVLTAASATAASALSRRKPKQPPELPGRGDDAVFEPGCPVGVQRGEPSRLEREWEEAHARGYAIRCGAHSPYAKARCLRPAGHDGEHRYE